MYEIIPTCLRDNFEKFRPDFDISKNVHEKSTYSYLVLQRDQILRDNRYLHGLKYYSRNDFNFFFRTNGTKNSPFHEH